MLAMIKGKIAERDFISSKISKNREEMAIQQHPLCSFICYETYASSDQNSILARNVTILGKKSVRSPYIEGFHDRP